MQMLEIAPIAHRPFPAMPGTLLHVIAWSPQPGKLVPLEKPTTLAFPIIGWGGVTVFQPLSVGPLATMLADALLAVSAVTCACGLEVAGLVYAYDAVENELTGETFGSVAEWQESAKIKDPMGGYAKKEWDKAVKALREEGDSPLFVSLRARDAVSITIPSPSPKPMTPPALPAERPIPDLPSHKPGTVPGPGMVEETPEEIAEARRNMDILRENGLAQTEPAGGAVDEDDDAANLV